MSNYANGPNFTGSYYGQGQVPPAPERKRKKSRKGLVTAGAVVGLLTVVGIANSGSEPASSAVPVVDPTPAATAPADPTPTPTPAPAKEEAKETTAPAKETTAPAPAKETKATQTMSQKQAVKKAESYLSHMSFSRSGLIGQLEYEGFSKADSEYAVDNITIDWNEQAAKKAESYLSHMAFSRSGLIDQLKYEGFTRAQAEYGVSAVGL